MAHLYELVTNQGTHNVTTPHHHEDHDEANFQKHLIDVIKQSSAQIISGLIIHRITYRGRR